jgi:hypothetical protein
MRSFDYIQNVATPIGDTLPVRYKAIIFRAGDKMIMVQLGTPEKFGEVFQPVMDQISDSVELIEEKR